MQDGVGETWALPDHVCAPVWDGVLLPANVLAGVYTNCCYVDKQLEAQHRKCPHSMARLQWCTCHTMQA